MNNLDKLEIWFICSCHFFDKDHGERFTFKKVPVLVALNEDVYCDECERPNMTPYGWDTGTIEG